MSKIIVITGAGVGLGRAVARRFASEGETVILLGRTGAKVEAVAAEIGGSAMALACDVADPASVRAAFDAIAERHPRIDVLINNAALFQPFEIANATDEQILGIVNTNLSGPIFCTRAAIAMMGRGGTIINVSSESVTVPFPHLLVYQSSKAGLERFTVGLQQELAERNIRVTYVRAGQMMEEGKGWDVDPDARRAFGMAAAKAGLLDRPISQFESVTQVFRTLIDLPADLQAVSIALHGRAAD